MAIEAFAIVEVEQKVNCHNRVAFCYIKLVDGRGKRPRWVVIRVLTGLRTLKSTPKRYDDPKGFLDKRPHGVFVFPANVIIKDRRITSAQIRHLFPECATMPLKIALDYVRDRL